MNHAQIPRCLHSEVPKKDVVRSIAQYLGAVFRKLTEQKESQIEEGHLMLDHVHMMISIPPQYAVSQVIGFIKGIAPYTCGRVWREPVKFVGQSF